MNTNRIINTDPLEDIDNDDDLLFTNSFVSTIPKIDITHTQKQNFRKYYEDKKKKLDNKKIIELVEEENIYEDYSKFKSKSQIQTQQKSDVIDKEKNNTIKTEKVSIISIDSTNRNRYKYPFQNDFELDFRQSFYNVKSIRLLSTAIPNTDQVIKDIPEAIRTDKISWQNLEDLYLGITSNCAATTTVSNTVDLTVSDHGLSTQEYVEPLTIWISDSTTTPSIDGQWSVTIVDSQTLRIPFEGGVTIDGVAKVDTGFPTYTVYLTPGNYNFDTLSAEMQRVMSLVKRRKGTGDFHYFTVDVSNDTDVVTIRSYITTPLELDPISTEINSSDILVNSEQHGFKDGDYVLLIGLSATGGLSSSILNGLFVVKEATRSTFKYEVSEKATFSVDGGGNSIKTGKPAEFRFLFDTAETKIVEHIGYPDEDSGVFMNTITESPLSIYTKTPTAAQIVGNYIEFTSIAHGLENNTVYTVLSISTGSKPTVTLSSSHNLDGIKNVFIYYSHSTPKLDGFYHITINGASTFYLNDVAITVSGIGTGQMKTHGDNIRLLQFKSIPQINEREFPVESATDDTFRIEVHEGIQNIQIDVIENTIIQTNKLYVNHTLHGFNELTDITAIPFLQVVWIPYTGNVTLTGSTYITFLNGLFLSLGEFNSNYNLQTSSDGINWVNGSINISIFQGGISYSSSLNRYIAVGDGSGNAISYSSDLIIWNTTNIKGDWYDIEWSPELELFVACGRAYYTDDSLITTSSDGINWFVKPVYGANPSDFAIAVVWSSELGLFVVITIDGTFYVSSDGDTWTPVSSGFLGVNWQDITWGSDAGLFVAVCYLGNVVSISSDGYNWTIVNIDSLYLNAISYSPELRLFVAVGSSGTDFPFITSRNGLDWVARSFTPQVNLRSITWSSSLLKFVASGDKNINGYVYLHSNITYGDVRCTTIAPHTYTGTRYNDADLDVYTVILNNADIDIPQHGLQTNDKIIVTDSTTTPDINGAYFVEVVDSDTVRIPVTLVAPGTCKVRTGDSIIFTGTNSIPKIDGIEATVIGFDINDPYYLELYVGVTITTPGTTGIIGRRNIVSIHRVESSEPYGDNFAGIPLEIINDTYHQITKIIDDNNYIVKLNKYALYSYSGGGSGITVSSERNGPRVFQSNTFTFEEQGILFRSVNLDGENYIFLISPKLQSVISPGNEEIGDIFAKILLSDVPGTIIYNSFISAPKIFNPPLGSLASIRLTTKRRDGYLFNFHNTDYSLSLEITEIVDQIKETGLSGRTGTSDIYKNEALRLT